MDDHRLQPAGSRPPAAAAATAGTAAAAATAAGVTLRPLASHDDYHACYELQLATWGRDFQEGVPPSVLKISQRVGGIAAGAFAAGGELLGYVYGLTGVRPPGSPRSAATVPARGGRARPELFHWSHMLAVAPQARDLGLGTRLKLYQRELLLTLGVEVVEWTYDPLEARNAHLNLNRLGAEVVEYVEDMYEGEMGSELARGIGTDRFIVAWRIADERVRDVLERLRVEGGAGAGGAGGGRAGTGGGTAAPPERFLDAPAIEPAPAGKAGNAGEAVQVGNVGEADEAGKAVEPPLPAAPRVRIEIPARIQEFKERQPERALAWRLGTRRAIREYLARGYQVTAFWRDAAGRCWYGVEAPGR
jgi:predicted GNAT superfamily acetyltransferase